MTTTTTPPDALGLRVPADLIGGHALFRSTEDARYYLQGVCIEPLTEASGVVGVATDGHTLGAVFAADGFAQRQIILDIDDKAFLTLCRRHSRQRHEKTSRWVCAMAWPEKADGFPGVKTIELALIAWPKEPPRAENVRHLLANERPDAKASAGLIARTTAGWIDATYPEWQRVIPHERFHVAPYFIQGAYLDRATDVSRCYGGGRSGPVRIVATSEDALAPHIIDVGFSDFIGVVMPIRHGEPGVPAVPGWLSIPTARTAELMTQREAEREATEAPKTHHSWRDAAAANAVPTIGANASTTDERIAA